MKNLSTDFKGRILAVGQLPALPAALDEVTRIMKSPSVTTEQIACAISQDQALTAKVLRLVNSPTYGFPGRIASLQHALVLLGFNVIRGLIISTVVFDAMDRTMKGLWQHSLACSLCCSTIAKAIGKENPEDFAVAGLLHDLGKAVFALQIPDAKEEVDALVATADLSFYDAEIKVLGFGHDRINCWLAEHWNLPPVIREGIACHHKPFYAESYPDVAAVTQLGDFLARLFQCGFAGDDGVNVVDPRSLKVLGINSGFLENILDDVSENLFGMLAQD